VEADGSAGVPRRACASPHEEGAAIRSPSPARVRRFLCTVIYSCNRGWGALRFLGRQ
jgi:hypothetical protein